MTPLTLSLRQRKLVHYLQLQSAYTTGQELASQLQVSARTIRNDIAEINQILNGTGIRIASKRRLPSGVQQPGPVKRIKPDQQFFPVKR